MRRCRKRGKEGWDDRESGGDRRARTPVTLTARYLKVFFVTFRVLYSLSGVVREEPHDVPFTLGRGVFLSFTGHYREAARFRVRSTSCNARRGGFRSPPNLLLRT